MRLSWPWAVAAGLVLGGAVGWWSQRASPDAERERQARAERAAAANARDARPVLYRWTDERGTVHYSDQAPRGRDYQRVDREPRAGIEVDGSRH